MCEAHRTTICFPVISSPMVCMLLKQQAALVIGFILFLPLLCMDQLYLFHTSIGDSPLTRPRLPCCSWAQALAVPDGRKAVLSSHACCRAKHQIYGALQPIMLCPCLSPALLCQCPIPPVTAKHLCVTAPAWLCAWLPRSGTAHGSLDPALPHQILPSPQSSPINTGNCYSCRMLALFCPPRKRRSTSSEPGEMIFSTQSFAGRRRGSLHCWVREGDGARLRQLPWLPRRACVWLHLLLGVAITHSINTTSTPSPNRHPSPSPPLHTRGKLWRNAT